MKIALICPDDISVVLFCKGLIKALRNNHKNRVYVISDILDENTDAYYAGVIKSWGVIHIPLEFHRFINPIKDLEYIFSLYKILRAEMIDTVINISTKPNIYGSIAARFANKKKILCSVWGRGTAFVDSGDRRSKLLRFLVILLYWITFRLSSRVWFTNLNDFNYFVSNGIVERKKTILTKNYVSTEDYYPYSLSEEKLVNLIEELGLTRQDKVVIMVGRMIWAKGVREFVEASKILQDKLPIVKFILVGPEEKGSWDAVPSSYLKESERSGNFHWVGFRNDVKDLYALADLAVLPSYYKEGGFPRALTEPMAMGKPLIAANTVDCRSPVEEGRNGYLVPVRNSKALADAIEKLIKDDEKMKAFGRYSRLKAEKELEETLIVRQVLNEFL